MHTTRTTSKCLLGVGVVMGAAMGLYYAWGLAKRSKRRQAGPAPDYRHRSGFPQSAASMRDAASDFETPRDMRAELPMPRYED